MMNLHRNAKRKFISVKASERHAFLKRCGEPFIKFTRSLHHPELPIPPTLVSSRPISRPTTIPENKVALKRNSPSTSVRPFSVCAESILMPTSSKTTFSIPPPTGSKRPAVARLNASSIRVNTTPMDPTGLAAYILDRLRGTPGRLIANFVLHNHINSLSLAEGSEDLLSSMTKGLSDAAIMEFKEIVEGICTAHRISTGTRRFRPLHDLVEQIQHAPDPVLLNEQPADDWEPPEWDFDEGLDQRNLGGNSK